MDEPEQHQEQDDRAPVRDRGTAGEDAGGEAAAASASASASASAAAAAAGGGGAESEPAVGGSVGVGVEEQVQGEDEGRIGGSSALARHIVDDGSSSADGSDGDSDREDRDIAFNSLEDALADLPGFAAEREAIGDFVGLAVHDERFVRPAELFGRFVAMLLRPEIARVLRSLLLQYFQFDNEDFHRPTDLNRLFGEVFVSLPALKTVQLVECTVPSSCLSLLASMPPASRLRKLDLEECDTDPEGLSHLVSMLRRAGPLQHLRLHPKEMGLDPDDCRLLCESVGHSRHLRTLDVKVKTVHGDTLANAAEAPASPLRALRVTGAFTDEGTKSLARQLRTNTRMRELHLVDRKINLPLYLHYVEDTIDTYNVTLQTVRVDNRPAFASSLRRNRRIRSFVRHLVPRALLRRPRVAVAARVRRHERVPHPPVPARATGERGRAVRRRGASSENGREEERQSHS
jgi:hypothetical protein